MDKELHLIIGDKGIKDFKIVSTSSGNNEVKSSYELFMEINNKLGEILNYINHQKNIDKKKMLTLKEVSEIYSLNLTTLRVWASKRKIPIRRIGSRVYVPVAKFEKWLESKEVQIN